MSKQLNKYTYDYFLKTGNKAKEYFDGNTKIVICSNCVENSKEKTITIEPISKNIKIDF